MVTLACALALVSLPAAAGVVIRQEQREPGNATPLVETSMYIDAGRLRIESRSAEGEHTITIFDESKQVLWVIDRVAGTYQEMTAAKMAEMKKRMEEARQAMEAELAQMPPERRRMIEEMMKQQLGGASDMTVREIGRGEKVGSFTCIHYEQLMRGKRSGEVWTASPDQLQLGEAEYKTFQALGRFLEPLGQSAPGGAGLVSASRHIEGFPVRSLAYDGGQAVAEEKVTKTERRALEPTLFALPSGLEKTEMDGEE
jgi:hypothetical protein